MSLYKLFGFAILGLALILVFRRLKEEYASFLSLILCLGLTICAYEIVSPVIEYLRMLDAQLEGADVFTLMFKSCGIAVLCTLAADICRDCGEAALGARVELCGKSVILVLCLPLLQKTFDRVFALL